MVRIMIPDELPDDIHIDKKGDVKTGLYIGYVEKIVNHVKKHLWIQDYRGRRTMDPTLRHMLVYLGEIWFMLLSKFLL